MKKLINEDGNVLLNEIYEKELFSVLVLLEKNNHLSASRLELAERRYNRNKAISILLDILEIDEKDFETMCEDFEDEDT